MDSLIYNPNDVHIAYDYIKQVYKDCDDNNLEPKWVNLLDKFVKRLNDLSNTKYFKSMFMQDLKNMQCKSQISQQLFDEYFATKGPQYVYNELLLDILHCLGGSDRFDTERDKFVYAFDKSPQHIASLLLSSEQEHTSRTLLEIFVDSTNVEKWEKYGVPRQTLAKIHNVRRVIRDMKYFLGCVNASFNSINLEKCRQEFEASTKEIIANRAFVGLGSYEKFDKAIVTGFSRYVYPVKLKRKLLKAQEPKKNSEVLQREREELQRLKQEKQRIKDEIERQKYEDPNFKTGDQHYVMMLNEIDALTEILIEKAKNRRKLTPVDGCYQFNELDLLLVKSHSIDALISVVSARIRDYYKEAKNGKFSRSQLERTLSFLVSANKASKPNAINTQIQFLYDGKPTPPTKEQVSLVKQYLKDNKIALNELTYTYALRRLIIGGDINTKFEIYCLTNVNENVKEEIKM